jgi:hypothetical protein
MLTGLVNLLLAGAMLTHPAASLQEIDGLRLRDQYGVEDSLAAHRGRVVVVMVVEARRLRTLKAWERELRERFDDIEFLRIAEVPDDPPPSYERVAAKLAEQVPEGVPVLIDMERRWAATLGLDPSRPNLLLVNPAGGLEAVFAGRHDPGLAAEVAARLDELMGRP